jgi:hypothetical protein
MWGLDACGERKTTLDIGTTNDNSILDTRVYEVTLDDGIVLHYAVNVIAKNLFTQVNQEDHRFVLLILFYITRRADQRNHPGL